jgi:hypothetical protein
MSAAQARLPARSRAHRAAAGGGRRRRRAGRQAGARRGRRAGRGPWPRRAAGRRRRRGAGGGRPRGWRRRARRVHGGAASAVRPPCVPLQSCDAMGCRRARGSCGAACALSGARSGRQLANTAVGAHFSHACRGEGGHRRTSRAGQTTRGAEQGRAPLAPGRAHAAACLTRRARRRADEGFAVSAALAENMASFVVRMAFLLGEQVKDKDHTVCAPRPARTPGGAPALVSPGGAGDARLGMSEQRCAVGLCSGGAAIPVPDRETSGLQTAGGPRLARAAGAGARGAGAAGGRPRAVAGHAGQAALHREAHPAEPGAEPGPAARARHRRAPRRRPPAAAARARP